MEWCHFVNSFIEWSSYYDQYNNERQTSIIHAAENMKQLNW